jgi:hypothetical protein
MNLRKIKIFKLDDTLGDIIKAFKKGQEIFPIYDKFERFIGVKLSDLHRKLS